ncbi:MAG TPA: hypothetical protein PKC03_07800 [Dokdonella sp.]|nr:hypothetical protein [Dokdonella sp.]
MRILSVLALTAAFFIAPCAHALTIDRMTTVMDETGGSLNISTQSTSFVDSGTSQADLVADGFSPRGEASTTGTISRTGNRTAESFTAIYNGNVNIATTNADGASVNIEVGLHDLSVLREGDGPEFSGTVTINGHDFEANKLPEPAREMVRRILRLFLFA